jgi:hypothetical protein
VQAPACLAPEPNHKTGQNKQAKTSQKKARSDHHRCGLFHSMQQQTDEP